MKPDFPERVEKKAMQVNGLSLETIMSTSPTQEKAADYLREWFRSNFNTVGKRLMPLTQNGEFDISHIKKWLGLDLYQEIFSSKIRDLMYFATSLNDKAAWNCQPIPFPEVGLKPICNQLGIEFTEHHDALADCIATAKAYRELLRMP